MRPLINVLTVAVATFALAGCGGGPWWEVPAEIKHPPLKHDVETMGLKQPKRGQLLHVAGYRYLIRATENNKKRELLISAKSLAISKPAFHQSYRMPET